MLQRKIGNNSVGAIGYGAMVLEGYYGASDDDKADIVLNQALDIGVTMIDTADAYGNGHNETVIAKAISKRRPQAFLASKFGIVFDDNWQGTPLPTGWGFDLNINGSSDNLQANLQRFAPLQQIATDLGITAAQLVLAWLLMQDENIIPIPGTRNPQRVIENSKAATVHLSPDILAQINKIAAPGIAKGATLV